MMYPDDYYSQADIQRLKAQVMAIALNHGVRAKTYVERIAQLKGKRLRQEEIGTMRKLCEALGVDYDELEPIKEGRK